MSGAWAGRGRELLVSYVKQVERQVTVDELLTQRGACCAGQASWAQPRGLFPLFFIQRRSWPGSLQW